MKVNGMSIPATLELNVVRGRVITNIALVIAGSIFIALAAQIAVPIPFTPVPLTLSPLAVLVVGIALGSRRGAAAAILYLLEGLSGLPVGAQGHGGPLWLIGPTAGYLYAYPFAACIAGWFSERGWGSSIPRAFATMLVALAVIYFGGWSWLAILAGPRAAFGMGIVPFVIADLVKIAIGAALLPYAQRLVERV
jgi:biotin transport system substrate-specific component